MIKEKKVKYFECDGCGYVFPEGQLIIKLHMQITPNRESDEFHFHPITFETRSDCLRYWITNPSMIKKSLDARGYSTEEIDEALRHLSYRESIK